MVAFLARANARRVAGAMCSVLMFTALSAPIDTLALEAGWWRYPSCDNPPHPPLPIYLGQAFQFVGCVALIAWRVQRRFGTRGVKRLGAIVCGVGLVRDLSVAAIFPEMIRFGAMPASAIADVGAWAVVVLVAVLVTRIVAGPASSDALRGA
jgi:hypothetical protein